MAPYCGGHSKRNGLKSRREAPFQGLYDPIMWSFGPAARFEASALSEEEVSPPMLSNPGCRAHVLVQPLPCPFDRPAPIAGLIGIGLASEGDDPGGRRELGSLNEVQRPGRHQRVL